MAIFLKSFNAFDRISKIKKSPADIFYSSPSRGLEFTKEKNTNEFLFVI